MGVSVILPVSHPPERPLLIFDGECTFCRRWVGRWQRLVGDLAGAIESQQPELATRFPELTRERLDAAVHLVEPDGRVSRGAEAVFRSLVGVWRAPLWAYEHLPGCARLSELVYRCVARRRLCLARGATGRRE